MKLLISGTTGFIGSNLLPYFHNEYSDFQPIGLNIVDDSNVFKNFLWKNIGDITPDYNGVIHLSGKAHDTNDTSDPQEYFRINTDLTKKLFDLFLESSARDFIYFSSVKAVADTVAGVLDENVMANPKTAYGQSKYKAEEYLLSKALPYGKRVFILRPCMIHGPGNKGNLNLLYNVVKRGIPYPLAAFDNKRSFLSVKNLLFIIQQLLDKPNIPSGVYNVADDEPLATSDVIRVMGEATGVNARIWSVSPLLIRAVAKVGDVFRLPLNSERLKKLTENYVVSNQKIKNVLGIQALPISSRDGLFETIKSFEK